MIKNVKFSDKFKYNLTYLKQNTVQFPENFNKIILLKIENIRIFPKMYPLFHQNRNYRKFCVKNYIILYRIKENSINIYNIFPTKSNYQSRYH